MKELYDVKDRLIDEIKEYAHAGKLTKDDALYLKALTGSADHLCNIIEKEDGYSGNWDGTRSYRRDSMGRYSRDGYSRHDLSDKLRELMNEAPDEHTRMEIKRLVDKM